MNTRDAYNNWSAQYDTNLNKTRDLEALSLRNALENVPFKTCLEIGCGTGKNSTWLASKTERLTSVDLSENMLAKAREKVTSPHVTFKQADITGPWTFAETTCDLVTYSLVLEHIENLDPVFRETAACLAPGGTVYIGELHPFKQYSGSKARFETEEGTQVVDCFTHHISDFVQAAGRYGLNIVAIEEYFDDNDRTTLPRILTLLFRS